MIGCRPRPKPNFNLLLRKSSFSSVSYPNTHPHFSPSHSTPPTASPAPGVKHRMPSLARSRLVRDVLLVFLGAISMHFITTLLHPFDDIYPTWTLQSFHHEEFVIDPPPYDQGASGNRDDKNNPVFDYDNNGGDDTSPPPASTAVTPVDIYATLPETEMVQHAPGWTVFKNLYMSNGTFYVVSDKPRSEFPELVYILSFPIPALNTPENIQARIPTEQEMDFIGTREAFRRWGPLRPGEKNRVWSVTGNTVCIFTRIPSQFFLLHFMRFLHWTPYHHPPILFFFLRRP